MIGQLNELEIEQVLQGNVIGRIGCCDGNKVYVVPVTYVYQDGYIVGHTGEGMKVDYLRRNPNCCFEVDHMENMANWQSVIAWGTFEELKGEAAHTAMQLLMTKLMPLITSQTSMPTHGVQETHRADTHGVKAVVYRIKLSEKTGRFEKR